jgi:enterochelin esterase-like enzyme/outer membrane protein assembly factor BamB
MNASSPFLYLHLFAVSSVVVALAPAAEAAGEWPNPRGPEFDGSVVATGAFAAEGVGLDLSWKVPVGSGYSGIAIAEGRAVTMFAQGESNWVAAFDTKKGKEVWRYKLEEITKGHDGSDDGPLSSPVIGGGRVYALGARGELVALKLADGERVWKKDLTQDFGSKAPHFGFGTTPLYEDDILVVQAGGSEGRGILGLNPRTGEKQWAHGDDSTDYQSPSVMTLAGERQVVAVSEKKITALSADDGDVLWVHELGEEDRASTAMPTFVGEDRFLVAMGPGVVVFRVSKPKTGYAVEEAYRSEVLGETYAPPVYHDGHVYGFRGQVLNCMNASNGERVWRSRPPGGDGLIAVGGRLVIFGSKGVVVVADATPEGYTERARAQALAGSSLSWPSFADDRVFVRNLEEMAAVLVTPGAAPKPAVAAAGNTEFDRFIAQIEISSDRKKAVDAFFAEHPQTPVVEGEWVYFVYRGDATDVAIQGSMCDSDTAEPMKHVDGTDLFYRGYHLEPGGRWEYRFQVDFEEWKLDPNNPRTVPSMEGEDALSELVTPGYAVGKHLDAPQGPKGRVEDFTLSSKILGYDKKITVWLPPGYAAEGPAYPLLIVNDGTAWLDKGLMATSLDNLVGKSVAPLVVAFVEPVGQWWTEAGGSRTDDYLRMQVEELIPALQERYRLIDDPASRAVMGNLFYGFSAAYAAVKYPAVFGKAGLQSVYLGLGSGDDLKALLTQGAGSSVMFYLDWNRYDVRNVDRGWDVAADSRALSAMLASGGYAVAGGEVLDSVGWGSWRNRTDEVLIALFPLR